MFAACVNAEPEPANSSVAPAAIDVPPLYVLGPAPPLRIQFPPATASSNWAEPLLTSAPRSVLAPAFAPVSVNTVGAPVSDASGLIAPPKLSVAAAAVAP